MAAMVRLVARLPAGIGCERSGLSYEQKAGSQTHLGLGHKVVRNCANYAASKPLV
jgi:hypothetical protein